MDDFQTLRPHTLGQRLHAWLHREPVSAVPHWDTVTAPALPTFDVEAEWVHLEAYIHRLADAGALDEAHGDLLDRVITHRVAAVRARLETAHSRRRQILALPELQAHQHLVELGGQVRDLRAEYASHRERRDHAWIELSGVAPAELSAELPVQADPLPAQVRAPSNTPRGEAAVAPVGELPVLHAVPEREREQG